MAALGPGIGPCTCCRSLWPGSVLTKGLEPSQNLGSQRDSLKWSPERQDQHLAETAAFLDRDSALTAAMSCVLCRRVEADPDTCGNRREKYGICAHMFCLYFATLLVRQEKKRVGLLGYLPEDIKCAVRRAAQKHCCICGQSGATIMCCEEDCNRWFHLPCAKEGGCVNHYFASYRSFCPEHRPVQIVEVTPEPETECPICMEPVEERMTFNTIVCPTCLRAWFHRDCLQGLAMRAGLFSFRCPLCRDHEVFAVEMFIMGIRIPFSQPTWEDNDAFADLRVRHSRCNARECLYPGGREEAEEEGPWELLLCLSCAAEGTHRRCSGLTARTIRWECDSCAGLSTGMRIRGHQAELQQRSAIGSGSPVPNSRDQQPQKPPACTFFLGRHRQPTHTKGKIQQLDGP
ncbi:PHD finger protein 7-like [Poecile atricapillus]|uniref:PHD finger protein 7-like n=1 Tax=Poecile atricapillus TaxID=48891 RepID=UPI002738C4EB|nr:PHD finger protein 7-like [Poecile atricapillus]